MRITIYTLLCLLATSSYSVSASNKGLNTCEVIKQTPTKETYDEVLARIKRQKYVLKKSGASKDSCRSYLLNQFEHHIFPYWIGTSWDYNGYANRPGKENVIACGYFVSTTLKHMGFKWNRYDLAKMYSLKIVEETCSAPTRYTDKQTMISALLAETDNLYIVGLDSHVGFLLKRGEMVWFVHSNYYGAMGPEKELASISPALNESQQYYVGAFFIDSNIDKWLNGTPYVFSD